MTIGTIVVVDIAAKMFVETKLTTVSCQPVASAADSCSAGSTLPEKSMPAPGWMTTLMPQARIAATTEKPITVAIVNCASPMRVISRPARAGSADPTRDVPWMAPPPGTASVTACLSGADVSAQWLRGSG